MKIPLPLASGWNWCGACAAQNQPITDEEAAGIMLWATIQIEKGAAGTDVLQALSWPVEIATRGTVCSCPPPTLLIGVPDNGFHVYMLYDDDERLLYVGMSRRLRSRLKTHYRKRAGYVVSHQVIPCATEQEMVELERTMIRRHNPPLNAVDNGDG